MVRIKLVIFNNSRENVTSGDLDHINVMPVISADENVWNPVVFLKVNNA